MYALARRVWDGASPLARAARVPLSAGAAVMAVATGARAAAYARGWFRARRLPRPAVGVGNLTVGGTGKTPVASWIADHFLRRGVRPGVLLRGGRVWGDEAQVHRSLLREALVVEDGDRVAGGERAAAQGADVLVLDDAFQRLDVRVDLSILLVSADSFARPRLLPAGPWRERLTAAARADVIVITRKAAGRGAAATVQERLREAAPESRFATLHLGHSALVPLWGGPASALPAGETVVASAGIADHASFATQLEQAGCRVERLDWPDHHRYTAGDVARIARAGRRAAHVVVTEKDAVKLRALWPRRTPAPLIARQELQWEAGEGPLTSALDGVLAARYPFDPQRHQT